MMGYYTGNRAYKACESVFIGNYAGRCNCQGKQDVIIGYSAARQLGRYTTNSTCLNVAVGSYALDVSSASSTVYCGKYNIALGYGRPSNTSPCGQVMIGNYATPAANNSVEIGQSCTTNVYLCGCLSKTSGTFQIVHPNPNKKHKWLKHSFVESPNRGDNIYRYEFSTTNCSHCIKLPDYYKYLNECNMAWVYPVDHFGEGYSEVDENKENLVIKTNKDGRYNVLLIGTRCDPLAVRDWNGVVRDHGVKDKLNTYSSIEKDG
tara:strand:- start:421 stop:1206 length:786 start_codon:yes stop_codon:yes gene_type:complete